MEKPLICRNQCVLVCHAARRLGRSERTIRRLIQQGKLHAQRLGRRRWLVAIADIEILRREVSAW